MASLNNTGEAQKTQHLIAALLGGVIVGLLALGALEALLTLIGSIELLLWKMKWVAQANLVETLKILQTNEVAVKVRAVLIVLTALAGGAGGVSHFFSRPRQRGWLTPWSNSMGLGISLLVVLAMVSIVGTIYDLEDALLLVFNTWWFRLLLLLMAFIIGTTTWNHLTKRVLPNMLPRVNKTPAVYRQARLGRQIPFASGSEQLNKILRRHRYRVAQEGDFLTGRKGVLNRFGSVISHSGFIIVLLGGFLTGLVGREGTVELVEGGSAATEYLPRLSKTEIAKRRAAGQGYFPGEIRPLGFEIRCLDFKTGFFPQTQVPSEFTSLVEITDGEKRFVDIVEVNQSLSYRGLTFHQSSYGEIPGQTRQLVLVTNRQTGEERELELEPGSVWPLPEWQCAVRLTSDAGGLRCEILRDDNILETHALAQADSYAFTVEVLDKITSELLVVQELDLNRPTPLLPLAKGEAATSLSLSVTQFVLDFTMGANQQVISKSNQPNNPAVQLALIENGKELHRFWLFQRPEFHNFASSPHDRYAFIFTRFSKKDSEVLDIKQDTAKQFAVRLTGSTMRYYTLLSVTSNPMIPLIYLGCLLMCLGLFFAFYWPTRTVLLWREPGKGVVRAVAVYREEQAELTNDIERLYRAIERAGRADENPK